MAQPIKVCKVSNVAAGSGKAVDAGGREVAVYNIDGKFFAIDNTCAHRGGSLGDGYVEGEIVTCPLHAWQYNVTSGQCQNNPDITMEKFPVTIVGDDVVVTA